MLAAVLAGAGVSVYLCAGHLADGTLRTLLDPPVPPLSTRYLAGRSAVLARRATATVRSRLLAAAAYW